MSARIYSINKDVPGRLWCGPAAICAVTGEPLSVVHDTIFALRERRGCARASNGRRLPIQGMWSDEILHVLAELGYNAIPQFYLSVEGNLPTFAQWRRMRDRRTEPLIVKLTDHCVVVAGNRLIDNQNREWVSLADYKGQRQRVRVVFSITKRERRAA